MATHTWDNDMSKADIENRNAAMPKLIGQVRTMEEESGAAARAGAPSPTRKSSNGSSDKAAHGASVTRGASVENGSPPAAVRSPTRMTPREKVGVIGAAFAGVGLIVGVAAAVLTQ